MNAYMGHITEPTLAATHRGLRVALTQFEPVRIVSIPRVPEGVVECALVTRRDAPLCFVPAERVAENAGRVDIDVGLIDCWPDPKVAATVLAATLAREIADFQKREGHPPRVVNGVRFEGNSPTGRVVFVRQLWPASDLEEAA